MNVAVCVKHAVDESELRVDGAGVPDLKGAQAKIGTFDRNAVEEAVKVKESKGGTVTVVSLGTGDWKKSIKEALAMGCDRGVAVSSPGYLDALGASYFLAKALQKSGPFDLVICSEGASDTYEGLIGTMVAEWMNLPFMGYVRRLEIGEKTAKCELALEEKVEVAEADLPVVISVVSEANTPRYPTLLQIMQTSKKPIEEVTLESLKGPDSPQRGTEVLQMRAQLTNRKKLMIEGSPDEAAKKLVDALKGEGVI
jgi:electron transfer flavoprotein beta subunit